MKRGKKFLEKEIKLWIRRFVLSVLVVFLYWANERFKIFSIHNPTCLLIIGSFFIMISIMDILISRILKIN